MQNFWHRNISENGWKSAWVAGGLAGIEIATAFSLAAGICLMPITQGASLLVGTVSLLATVPFGYFAGGLFGWMMYVALHLCWRWISYVHAVGLGILFAFLLAYFPLNIINDAIFMSFQCPVERWHAEEWVAAYTFLVLPMVLATVGGGRLGEKFYEMFERTMPTG